MNGQGNLESEALAMTGKSNVLPQLISSLFTLVRQAVDCFCRGCEAYRVWSGE